MQDIAAMDELNFEYGNGVKQDYDLNNLDDLDTFDDLETPAAAPAT